MTEKLTKAQEQMAELPLKLSNNHEYQDADKTKVMINGFELFLDNVKEPIIKYELKFRGFAPQRTLKSGKVIPERFEDFWRGERNDVSNRSRARLNYALFVALVNKENELFKEWDPNCRRVECGYAYDCATILYSRVDLLKGEKIKRFQLLRDSIAVEHNSYIRNPYISHFIAELSGGDEKIYPQKINSNANQRDRSAIQFLEVLYNQHIYQRDSHFVFPEKLFRCGEKDPIYLQGDPRILLPGLAKNIHVVGDGADRCRTLIQVDHRRAAFFPKKDLITFMKDMLRSLFERDVDLTHCLNDGRPNYREAIIKHLKGVCVRTTHLEINRAFIFNGLTDKPASQLFFKYNGNDISVKKYYTDTYNMRLRHHEAYPCVIEYRNKRDENGRICESFYPLEVLEICEGQRVAFHKQTPKLTEQMIRNCQSLPREFEKKTMNEKGMAYLSNDNPYCKAYNVRVNTQLEQLDANILYPPQIFYDNTKFFDLKKEDPAWRTKDVKFYEGVQVGVWVMSALQNCLSDVILNEFAKIFTETACAHGMQMNVPNDYRRWYQGDMAEAHKYFKTFKENKVQYVVCITENKMDPIHNLLKLMEKEYGIVTQHIWGKNVKATVEQRNRTLTINNIIMKANAKLGGCNWILKTSFHFENNNRAFRGAVDKHFVTNNRMFMGLDFSHAAPQTRYERNKGIPVTEPTVVAMVYTLDKPTRMAGEYWYQQPRVTHTLNLEEHVVQALKTYRDHNGHWPLSIVLFRNGVSEGEYRIAITYEQSAFNNAFERLIVEGMPRKPSLLILVVQKNSNYRVVPVKPLGERASEQNVPAGTVVDQSVMSASTTEFLLVAHKTIQGTARPSRCTVIYDNHEPRVKLQDLEYMTYTMCYTHGIVTSPVSVPGPLYAAGDLAKRGRNNFKAAKDNDMSLDRREDEEDNTFFDRLTGHLHASLRTKYWA